MSETKELVERLERELVEAKRMYAQEAHKRMVAAEAAAADAASLRARVAELEGLIRWAHDTLYEINPSNYDHDEVCKLNNASVEVILGLAQALATQSQPRVAGDGQSAAALDWPALVQLGRALGLFASVIKSGEPWTDSCQKEYDKANAAMKELWGELNRPIPPEGAVTVAQGWRLVPVKPTEEMLRAGEDARRDRTDVYFDGSEIIHGDMVADVYSAMLAAAPTPPVNQSEGADRG